MEKRNSKNETNTVTKETKCGGNCLNCPNCKEKVSLKGKNKEKNNKE